MTTYVLRDGKLVEKYATERPTGPQIMPDIQPYKSMIDGHMVTSRSEHRIHLRDHNCIEIGNEKMESAPPAYDPGPRRKILHQQLENMTDREANRILAQLRETAPTRR